MDTMHSQLVQIITVIAMLPFIGVDTSTIINRDEDPAVTKLREYLRIPTVHPNPDPGYQMAIKWLSEYGMEIGLDVSVVQMEPPALFAFILTWTGSDPCLPSVMINSHMDVVAVEPSKWEHPPFDAFKDDQGYIWARGALDMKSKTIACLEAIRKLKLSGFVPTRTIHTTIMPDEEVGGARGTEAFVKTVFFKNMNIGIDVDEGGSCQASSSSCTISYGQKSPWHFNITAHGTTHGGQLPEYTAGQRLQAVIDRLFEFRTAQLRKLQSGELTIEEVTTVNLVQIGGGASYNIIPEALWVEFDMRIRNTSKFAYADAEKMLAEVVEEARLGSKDDPDNKVEIDFLQKDLNGIESVANSSNFWWTLLQKTCRELNFTCAPQLGTAAGDGRFVRNYGISVFGVSLFVNSLPLTHQTNERINEAEFLTGIDRYVVLIRNLAQLPKHSAEI